MEPPPPPPPPPPTGEAAEKAPAVPKPVVPVDRRVKAQERAGASQLAALRDVDMINSQEPAKDHRPGRRERGKPRHHSRTIGGSSAGISGPTSSGSRRVKARCAALHDAGEGPETSAPPARPRERPAAARLAPARTRSPWCSPKQGYDRRHVRARPARPPQPCRARWCELTSPRRGHYRALRLVRNSTTKEFESKLLARIRCS